VRLVPRRPTGRALHRCRCSRRRGPRRPRRAGRPLPRAVVFAILNTAIAARRYGTRCPARGPEGYPPLVISCGEFPPGSQQQPRSGLPNTRWGSPSALARRPGPSYLRVGMPIGPGPSSDVVRPEACRVPPCSERRPPPCTPRSGPSFSSLVVVRPGSRRRCHMAFQNPALNRSAEEDNDPTLDLWEHLRDPP
jgi:hypothetical protein